MNSCTGRDQSPHRGSPSLGTFEIPYSLGLGNVASGVFLSKSTRSSPAVWYSRTMPSDQESRLLALAAAQGGSRIPVEVPEQRPIRVTAEVRIPFTDNPNANSDIYPESLLQRVMMDNVRKSVEAGIDELVTASVELPVDSIEAQAIMEGRHTSMSMGASVAPDPTLTELFMDSPECQEAASALGIAALRPGTLVIPSDGMHIEFDGADEYVEGRTTPNDAARFQIGRESPPPTSFSRETFSGPSEGQVVSQRGADGRFQVTQRRSRALEPRDPVRRPDPLSRPVRQSQGRIVPAPPQAKVREPQPPPPTRYERMLGNDDF